MFHVVHGAAEKPPRTVKLINTKPRSIIKSVENDVNTSGF
jgi:hypothetical protein